jgi:hypothetical protein
MPTQHNFASALAGLRDGDPDFAEASLLCPEDMSEWQAAIYLLSGCKEVWRALGAAVCTERSISPVIGELADPRRAWSGSETEAMEWAAHFWDVNRYPAHFPYRFEEFYFRRWIVACQLHKGLTPVTHG